MAFIMSSFVKTERSTELFECSARLVNSYEGDLDTLTPIPI
jgi:hypothetical protein